MRTFNMTKIKENQKNSKGRVGKNITCYMCIFIIGRKIPIIYDLIKFFVPRK